MEDALPSLLIEVMIRPRVGDFRYTNDEMDVMLEDIASMKDLGVRGFVVGVLTDEGRVDIEAMKKLVDTILPLEVCFHRAFDMTRDPDEALRDIIDIGGISRILTSGHAPKAPDALPVLEKLFDTAKSLFEEDVWGITVMPGSGINHKTVGEVVQQLLPKGLREIHLSGGHWVGSTMQFRKDGMGMAISPEYEWSIWQTREKEIKKVRYAADVAWDDYWDTISAAAEQEEIESETVDSTT
ncbi:copper homeostasis protein cutC [Coprinopsis cinerea okayama7|uniref:Copper homeostasis protein cutC homolog n=1 Tax=Coprinopsis cinerea (strain Okayama-7 / 130 / ATCC MYA-4618 / FGSC 9003) TaxID=240176 RepID=A8N306_COPC7|nr:copper homeostasis protein cutC [Coprinopsis cinerea okayama7\|eukprot:XP_001829241.2 copper homeostasis protein cutC [Coprinopsis cinerea okayama7\